MSMRDSLRPVGAFELFLFSVDPDLIRPAVTGGVSGVIVDWEHAGKQERQRGLDTEINKQGVDELSRVRGATSATVICRVNAFNPTTRAEIERAIDMGADEVLLPMVRTVSEVETVLGWVSDRCGAGILIETRDALEIIRELGRLPLTRVLLGLMDLAIARASNNLFMPVVDGTVEAARRSVRVPLGWGGLTLPERGHPIPCRLLIAEMVRLGSDFSFLRRSFHRDIAGIDPAAAVQRILDAVEAARLRPPSVAAEDAAAFRGLVTTLSDGLSRDDLSAAH